MKNLVKQKLSENKTAIGAVVMLPHPDVTRCLSQAGFDWLFIDAEHGPMSLETMQQMINAMASDCTPIIRVEWNNAAIIKRTLDLGAHGVIVPMVNTGEEAEMAVRACKYPPQGIRGFGPRLTLSDPKYYATANREIMTIALIESATAVKNIDDILSVEGIDVGFIGVADLSLSLGFGLPIKWQESKYLEVFERVVKAAKRYGKAAGIPTGIAGMPSGSNSAGSVEWAIEKGFRMISVGDADSFIIEGARQAVKRARKTIRQVEREME
jgi:2-keto-3-deoxy-L-rhamnonate aldolase RhmA